MNNEDKFIIVNTSHNSYLTIDKNTRLDYFQLDKTIAKTHTGLSYAQFVCDIFSEQYPQYNFIIKQVN